MPLDPDSSARASDGGRPAAHPIARLFSAIDHLLRNAQDPARRPAPGSGPTSSSASAPTAPPPALPAPTLLALAVVCLALYGASAGFYQGGIDAVLLAALKTPLIVLGALGLCVPSLYVFATLAGGRIDAAALGRTLAGFAALIGVVLVALIPISWLFSVGSRGLWFLVVLHLAAWVVATALAGRSVERMLDAGGSRMSIGPWVVLLLLVTLQMTTHLRPILVRGPSAPLLQGGKLSFLEHYGQVLKEDARRP